MDGAPGCEGLGKRYTCGRNEERQWSVVSGKWSVKAKTEADSSAALHPSEQRPLAGDPGLRNDKQERRTAQESHALGLIHPLGVRLAESLAGNFHGGLGGCYRHTGLEASGHHQIVALIGAVRIGLQRNEDVRRRF